MGPDGTFDPRAQVGPFKYDLYGVSNHMGTLSSGHCEFSFFLFLVFGLARRRMTDSRFRYGFCEE